MPQRPVSVWRDMVDLGRGPADTPRFRSCPRPPCVSDGRGPSPSRRLSASPRLGGTFPPRWLVPCSWHARARSWRAHQPRAVDPRARVSASIRHRRGGRQRLPLNGLLMPSLVSLTANSARSAGHQHIQADSVEMTPEEFCARVRSQLAAERADDGWVRGASALCEMYAGVDAPRFEAILVSMAAGRTGSAVADGLTLASGALAGACG